jgi:AcrR family transcriptional regulator
VPSTASSTRPVDSVAGATYTSLMAQRAARDRGRTVGSRRSTLQQERSVNTRAALVDAGERLWSEYDIDSVTVSDLCTEAAVSKGLFYFYFATKEDLLIELLLTDADAATGAIESTIEANASVHQVIDKGVAALVRRTQRRPRHLLARAVAEWFAALERHGELTHGRTPLRESVAAAVRHGQDRGELDTIHDADDIAGMLEWAVLQAALEWATATSRQPSLAKRVAIRTSVILRGVGGGI